MSKTNDYCGVVRTYRAYKELYEEYFVNAGKKKGFINHIGEMDNYLQK